ncbi:MAG: hypothetical protein FD174_2613 [Geobacteraceae bacterium]|nr:MAG: hypothetical protein FD174_2613 [Geobacteraceae bacterium]
MQLSDLINELSEIMSEQGDMQVFCGDMEAPQFEVREAEEKDAYGERYLFVEIG